MDDMQVDEHSPAINDDAVTREAVLGNDILDFTSLVRGLKVNDRFQLILKNKWGFSLGQYIYKYDISQLFALFRQTPGIPQSYIIGNIDQIKTHIYEHRLSLFDHEVPYVPGITTNTPKRIIYVPRGFIQDYIYPYMFSKEDAHDVPYKEFQLFVDNHQIIKDLALSGFPAIMTKKLVRQLKQRR